MNVTAASAAKKRMLAGEPYRAADPQLVRERNHARRLVDRYNRTAADDEELRNALLSELLGELGAGVWIEPPFHCDYGSNIFIGRGTYLNVGCIMLDCNRIDIGKDVLIGPLVQVYAATHSTDPQERATGREYALPVKIGDNAWIGGGAIICPGVTIGADTTIGAGSVVVRDVPAGVVAAGNPCRVIKNLS